MKTTILSLLICSFLVSCKTSNSFNRSEKNVVFKKVPSFTSFYNPTLNSQKSGEFMISATSLLGYIDVTNMGAAVSGDFYNKKKYKAESGQPFIFNGISVQKDDPYAYHRQLKWDSAKKLFGTNLNLVLPMINSASTLMNASVGYNGGYSPNIFYCTNNFLDNVASSDGKYVAGTTLKPAFKFQWNADTLNKNGVFIYLEYDPTNFANVTLKTNFPNKVGNGVIVPDNGEYYLSAELFDGIPNEGNLNVYIGRGNFTYLTKQDGNVTDILMIVLTYQNRELFYRK